ncbi:lectin [Novilysobacter erysipheiresistens]|uniref:Lectin n=1 Tax=Novilysobacter erysipheiresistens TaxID=1749332 RepID=A0ABU7YZ01_9GAMM
MKLALPTLTLGILLAIAACADRGAEDVAESATPSPDLEQPPRDASPDDTPTGTPTPDTSAGAPEPGDGPASYNGFADAEFGMDAEQVRAVWDGELDGGPGDGPGAESASCFHLSPAGQWSMGHFALMFGDGGFARYSVANDEMTAPGGGRRGMDDAEIVQLYGDGNVERQPHKYSDGEYLRIHDPAGSDAVLIFETDAEGTVTEWRVGLPPHVDYVEGCA